jgi:hypothetical protein
MEKKTTKKTIPLDYIRGLLVAQGGRCAITGMPLDPHEVNADHIVPLSREELEPSVEENNFWLVHKKINAMKGTMTYAEFVEACRAVLDHQEKTQDLLIRIQSRGIRAVSKVEFDNWVEQHYDKKGKLGSEQIDAPNKQ